MSPLVSTAAEGDLPTNLHAELRTLVVRAGFPPRRDWVDTVDKFQLESFGGYRGPQGTRCAAVLWATHRTRQLERARATPANRAQALERAELAIL